MTQDAHANATARTLAMLLETVISLIKIAAARQTIKTLVKTLRLKSISK